MKAPLKEAIALEYGHRKTPIISAKGEDELAQRIMHDDTYHSDKSIIMGPIGEFVTLLDDRTEQATLRFRRWGDLLQLAGLILTAFALVTAWLGIRRHAARPESARRKARAALRPARQEQGRQAQPSGAFPP
jgi:hypothetical protein